MTAAQPRGYHPRLGNTAAGRQLEDQHCRRGRKLHGPRLGQAAFFFTVLSPRVIEPAAESPDSFDGWK